MASRGRKRVPDHLRLVTGNMNTTRHGTEDEIRSRVEQGKKKFGPLVKPEIFNLKKYAEASITWDRYIAKAWWLDASREVLAIAYCMLVQELFKKGGNLATAKHSQLRAYASELGLSDERKRPSNADQDKDDLLD
jgi:hypothetical protein